MKSWRWPGVLAFGVVAVVLCVAERRRPLRRRIEPQRLQRAARNAVLGSTALIASACVEWAIVKHAGAWATRHRVGLLHHLRLPRYLKQVLGFLALDYSIYLWHVANHRAPVLWRLHVVHHIDRELDTSTGVRFHFGEMTLTAALRAAQILVIGVDHNTLGLWQRLVTLSVLFHHSNVRLPIGLERVLALFIVTPRLHGVHHSERRAEIDSNYASLLSLWDVVHGTRCVGVPQQTITIGIPGRRDAGSLTTGALLAMPFRLQRPSWLDAETSPPGALPHPRGILAE